MQDKPPSLIIETSEVTQVLALWLQFKRAKIIQSDAVQCWVDRLAHPVDSKARNKGKKCTAIPIKLVPYLRNCSPSQFASALVICSRYISKRGYSRTKVSDIQIASSLSRQKIEQGIKDLIQLGYLSKIEQHPNFTIAYGSKYVFGPSCY